MDEHFNEATQYLITADTDGGRHIVVERTEFVRKNARWSCGKKSYAMARGEPVKKIGDGVFWTLDEPHVLLIETEHRVQ